jgi:hypothetical protein
VGNPAKLRAWDPESLYPSGVETSDDGLLTKIAYFGNLTGSIQLLNFLHFGPPDKKSEIVALPKLSHCPSLTVGVETVKSKIG